MRCKIWTTRIWASILGYLIFPPSNHSCGVKIEPDIEIIMCEESLKTSDIIKFTKFVYTQICDIVLQRSAS